MGHKHSAHNRTTGSSVFLEWKAICLHLPWTFLVLELKVPHPGNLLSPGKTGTGGHPGWQGWKERQWLSYGGFCVSRDGSLEFILWVTRIHQSVSTRNTTWQVGTEEDFLITWRGAEERIGRCNLSGIWHRMWDAWLGEAIWGGKNRCAKGWLDHGSLISDLLHLRCLCDLHILKSQAGNLHLPRSDYFYHSFRADLPGVAARGHFLRTHCDLCFIIRYSRYKDAKTWC